jgi:putative ABC transport system permease protein
MKARKILGIAWENLGQRRLRTSLTTLSVVIGITAIIGLASLGEGFRIDIRARLQSGFELDNLTVIPGSLFAGLSRERFTEGDVRDISEISGVKIATGVIQIGNVTLYNGDKSVQAFVATAVNFTEFIQVFPDRFTFDSGTLPQVDQNDSIVIGYKVNHPSETEAAPFVVANDNVTVAILTSLVTSQNYTFTVAGTLEQKGTPGITNFDYWVFLPVQKAEQIFFSSSPPELDLIFAKVYDTEDSERIADEIEALFPPFRITILVPLTFIRQVDSILTIVQLFLMAIASISLVVAGIGIMNIMMVSVMERTREIGILKAVGAKNRTVLSMFLAEALLIGVFGGVIGVVTGYGLSYALAFLLSNFIPQQQGISPSPQTPPRLTITPVFSAEWTLIGIVFAIVICVIFGLYPARKGSKLNPVEALRYE